MCTICILYLSARYFEYNRSLSQCLHFLFKRTQVSVSAWDGMFSTVLRLLRRTFWLLFGVLTALLCDIHALPLSLPFSRKKVSRQNLDVLIVGAGISGIAIAKVVIHRNKTRPERGLQLRRKANHKIIRQYRCTVLIYFDWPMGCDRKCVTHSLIDGVRRGSKCLSCFRN